MIRFCPPPSRVASFAGVASQRRVPPGVKFHPANQQRKMDSTLWSRTPLATRPSRYDTGAFATEDIDEGTIVIPEWNESFDGEGWIRLDRRQVGKLPPDLHALFRRYGLDVD